MKNRKMIIIVVVITLLLFGLYKVFFITEKNFEVSSKTYYDFFDTRVSVSIYSDDSVDETIFSDIENRLSEIDEIASSHQFSKNNVSDLNQNNRVDYNQDLENLLQAGIDTYNNYSTQFNISFGEVIDIWKGYLDDCNQLNKCLLPSDEELKNASLNTNPNDITIGTEITIKEGMKLDLGAITKGYATDQIAKLLESNGFKHFLIDAGGNVYGTIKPNQVKFKVGIVDPENSTETFTILNIEDKSVVTSGDYERYFEVDDVRYSHLINTETLYPSTYFKSVSIISDKSIDGDIWSTMIFNLPYEDGIKLVESRDDIEAIWYVSSEEVYKSSGVSDYEEE